MTYNDSMFLPPWLTWSNDFINTENWDEYNDQLVFKHPGGHVCLPTEIAQSVKLWKRPGEIFSSDGLVVQTKGNANDIDNLLTVNESLMNVKVYRWILYHIVLYTSRFKNKWPQPWHPSNLVFSCCKTEVAWNKKSKPEYNPFGKYWLKLFYMGKFRMICVSDHLPISADGRILLPLCEDKKVLWLPLLVKGLLRIYSLTDEFDQFNTITCLTGWSCIQKNCQLISKENVWSSILSHSSYSVLDTENLDSDSKQKNKNISKHEDCFQLRTITGTQLCHYDELKSIYGANPPNSIVVGLTLTPTICKENNSKPLSGYSQPLFLNYAKMIKNKSLPTWKKYRWTKWATDNNLIKKHELNDFMRLVNVYAPCTTVLNQTSPLMKLLNKYKSNRDENQYELDFSYLKPFTSYINFTSKKYQSFRFFKPVIFQQEESPVYDIDPSTQNNCCAYLHFESPYCQSMLFTLSVCKNYTIHNGNIELDAPSNRYAIEFPYINVEQFLWYETKLPTPLSTIRSRGVSNVVINFKPGVNVLKIWGELPAKYSLTIESTADFSLLHTVQTVYEKLIDKPKSLTSLLETIKQTFSRLCSTEPNTGDRGKNLLRFYSSFMPYSVNNETELKKIERLSNISKQVQTAMVKCLGNKFSNDVQLTTELYTELQELLQNKSLGLKEISALGLKQKPTTQKSKPAQNHHKKIKNEKSIVIKKSVIKSKINHGKSSPVSAVSKVHSKPTTSKIIYAHMFEVLCYVFHSDEIDLNEYHFKNDLFNYLVNIIFDENTTKPIDTLLLFRLELNTHSTSELVPTIIKFSNKNNSNFTTSITLIDNDTQMEVTTMNIDMNMYMVRNTIKGYTLIGWSSEKIVDYKNFNYKLELFGRPYEILHSCGTQKDYSLQKYNTTICDNTYTPEYVIKHVKKRFYMPNAENLLARALLNIEKAALFTIYCHLEHLDDVMMEIRVVDLNLTDGSSTVYASSRARGKTALISAIFLDPNLNNNINMLLTNTSCIFSDSKESETKESEAENLTSIVFVIEVILIKNIDIDYINIRNDINQYDWTISCTYDKKATGITLEATDVDYNFHFISSIPHQIQPPIILQKSQNKIIPTISNSNFTNKIDKNDSLTPSLSFHEMFELMTANQDLIKEQVMDNDSNELFIEKITVLINKIKEITNQQDITMNLLSSAMENKAESRLNSVDELNKQVLNLLQLQRKSNMNVKQSRMMKKKSRIN
ncbi:uncharacterized protein LOC112596622 [Melanaphis sacchari]|uniref:uncharacterized protein LOC112596622 n=1 Tax=Melanaphis sacchari TaxID=742174 RepID=UPI000DC139C1|nr:uncharacterized protein LOC112596622 [Melanaphis sacchari]